MSGYLSLANGTRVAVRNGFVLGRVAGCDLVLDDSKASRRHAKIHVESGVVEIEDLQSSNGTLLNDKPVTRRLLRDGDRVMIGKTVITFHEGELPGGAAASTVAEGAVARATPAGSAIDDNDLFGDAPATSINTPRPSAPPPPPPPPPPPVRPAPVASAPAPPRAQPSAPPPAPTPPSARPAPPAAPAPPAPPAVVEFEDEVVEIRKPAPAPAANAPASKPVAGGAAVAAQPRVLQFHKQGAGGGLLGDDLGQIGGGMRALLVLGALALGAGIVWLVISLMR